MRHMAIQRMALFHNVAIAFFCAERACSSLFAQRSAGDARHSANISTNQWATIDAVAGTEPCMGRIPEQVPCFFFFALPTSPISHTASEKTILREHDIKGLAG
jgi:hypothetical protein